ncbi:hypothetical protein HBH70_234710 [Parastagonospora nodorum]|nr:hypothetical protein HBH70_234710 [Parastagonospora nodorum]KAH5405658.1 hypothetical protein HBI47_177350 [Parastagonospora nodorum]KAH5663380.1 hypothetical protein HBI23_090010 [Parastagonospora nodorum]KAH6000586.1 hypothetical protein HBI84_100420 [Parastagonospora nodorum]
MVSRGVPPFGSGSFHDQTMPVGPHPPVSQPVDDNHQYSFYETYPASTPESYVQTQASAEIVFSPWLELPSTSPLSRTSSLAGSEYVPTPPSFIERPPIPTFPMMDHQLESSSDYLSRYINYLRDQELAWRQYLLSDSVSQPPPPRTPFPAWNPASYEIASVHAMEYHNQPFTNKMVPSFIQSTPETRKAGCRNPCSMPSYTESGTTSSISDSDDSESEDDNSIYSKRERSRSNSGSSRGASHRVPVLKLGKWDMLSDPFSRPQPRHYVCGRIENDGPNERHCRKSFMRPEHLRRHIKTVHGEARDYFCKLPRCHRAFSRGDNLREHYWTHLERGGRAGKNDKMSFAELKAVLGPKEKKLLRRLKHRLSDHQAKLSGHQLKIRSKL